MKMQIKEFSELTEVSVRTLRYYDEIGLLKPAYVDENSSYRYYDEGSLLRMQEILFYRELDFSLKSIGDILSSPDYDKQKALREQKQLLILKKERLERLIIAVDSAKKGGIILKAFDNSDFDKYKAEAKERWGSTEAYGEYEQKAGNYSDSKFACLAEGMDSIMSEFALAAKQGYAPSDDAVQSLVKKLQDYISENFYNCTKEILGGLGQMYVCDERFRSNIDKHSEGTAEYIAQAIGFYCR